MTARAVLLVLFAFAPSALAQITVTNTSDAGPGSLRQAVMDAPDGTIIEFAFGIGSLIALETGSLTVSGKSITIRTQVGREIMSVIAFPADSHRILEIAAGATVTLDRMYFSNGYDPNEGGCIHNAGTLSMVDSSVLFGAAFRGGGVFSSGTLAIVRCEIRSNTASVEGKGSGGGIWSSGPTSITDSHLGGNHSDGDGGALWCSGTLSMNQSEVGSNTSGGSGGGIHLAGLGPHSIASSMVSFNRARVGGGLRTSTPVNLFSTSVVGNIALEEGGGIFSDGGSQYLLHQCTVAANKALVRAGGLHVGGNFADLRHCTLTANTAPSAPGVDVVDFGIAGVHSTIIAGHEGADIETSDGSGSYISLGYNLIGSGSTAFFTKPGDRTDVGDPGLAPLGSYGGPSFVANPIGRVGYNGGPMLAAPPVPGSLAIDAGDPSVSAPPADQLGAGRVIDGDGDALAVIDIGAVEGVSVAFHFKVLSPGDSGPGTLRQAILDAPTGSPSIISVDPSLTGSTIALATGALQVIDKRLLIDAGALASPLEIDAGEASRHFSVADNASLILRNFDLHDGDPRIPGIGDWRGGSIRNFGALTLDACIVSKNTAQFSSNSGGGIYHGGSSLLLSRCTIRLNRGRLSGGGGIACNHSGPVWIDRSLVSENSAESAGGLDGSISAALVLCDSVFQGNSTLSSGSGGAFSAGGSITALSTTFAGNTASGSGGAVLIGAFRPALFHQCTFSENSAGTTGGAIQGIGSFFATLQKVADLHHCTLTGNTAPLGGDAVYLDANGASPTIAFHATIVSGNGTNDLAPEPGAVFLSAGYNLVGTGGGTAFMAPGDQNGVTAPGLAPLGDYGGPTPTHALLPGSPARDAGPLVPFFGTRFSVGDQRGFPRQLDADGDGVPHLDIGAYEAGGAAGGFAVWTVEHIPEGPADRSFTGDADSDGNANGLEYGSNTNPVVGDADHPNNLGFFFTQGREIRFGYRPDAPDLVWTLRRTADLAQWTDIYRFDGVKAVVAPGFQAYADPQGGRIHVIDFDGEPGRFFYDLHIDLRQ